MPHLLIERARTVPELFLCGKARPVERTKGQAGGGDGTEMGCIVEVIDLIGALIFLVGSVCILPGSQRTLEVFLAGCFLFILGGAVYFGLHLLTFYEAWVEQGLGLEAMENAFYVGGSMVFLAGTVLYWPEEAHHAHMEWLKGYSIGMNFDLFTPEFEGTLLFIAGSVLFGFAAVVNGVNQRSRLLLATISMYLAGSLLFVVGSILYLPNLGIALGLGNQARVLGAWCFIIGSLLYVVGGLVNLARTVKFTGVADENTPLVGKACGSAPPPHTSDLHPEVASPCPSNLTRPGPEVTPEVA